LDGVLLAALAIDGSGNTSELSPVVQSPLGRGEPEQHVVPGVVQAEQYREGRSGEAFHDSSPGNSGGAYRSDDVDIRPCAPAEADWACNVVGWTRDGEWIEYDIWVEDAGEYALSVSLASPFDGRSLRVSVDTGEELSITVPDTGSYHRWEESAPQLISLDVGRHRLRLTIDGGGFIIDALTFERR
jgi:hypothetical protein